VLRLNETSDAHWDVYGGVYHLSPRNMAIIFGLLKTSGSRETTAAHDHIVHMPVAAFHDLHTLRNQTFIGVVGENGMEGSCLSETAIGCRPWQLDNFITTQNIP
jgi:hypothetical protein